jgi:hypothetical protein
MNRHLCFGGAAFLALMMALPGPAGAQCLKPWAIPDRWDDITVVPGWPQWAGNSRYDREKFTDTNGDGLWEPGEPFYDGVDAASTGRAVKGGKDGVYTAEGYHPLVTGYTSKDFGHRFQLRIASPGAPLAAGQFLPIHLCLSDCAAGEVYRESIVSCNPIALGPGDRVAIESIDLTGTTLQEIQELIDQDPGAYWGTGCGCIQGSAFAEGESPRIAIVPFYDPRIPVDSGQMQLRIVKIIAMFIDTLQDGDVYVYFMPIPTPVGARASTWGSLKAVYR